MFRSKWFVLFVLFGLVSIVVACTSKETMEPQNPQAMPTLTPTTETEDGGTIEGEARVSGIEILILESFPVQVNVVARGSLPDGCTEIDRVEQMREGDTFRVTITTRRPRNQMCTEAEVPFEEVISLDVAGLEAGEYTVDVNGVRDTFELAVDNVLPEEPRVDAPSTDGAMIEQVEAMLSEDDPTKMVIAIEGNLRDGCTEIVDVQTQVAEDEIVIQVLTVRPADRMCTQALVPFEEQVTVDVSDLSGNYTLAVNAFSTTVDLDALAGE
jgi:hypothetical protein